MNDMELAFRQALEKAGKKTLTGEPRAQGRKLPKLVSKTALALKKKACTKRSVRYSQGTKSKFINWMKGVRNATNETIKGYVRWYYIEENFSGLATN